MKIIEIKKILTILMIGLLISSCTEEITREPSPAQNPNSTNVYFPNTNSSNVTLAIDATNFEVTIAREETGSAQTVALTPKNSYSDIFSIPSSVTFEAGESEKTIQIDVNENIELNKSYHFAIEIAQEETKQYTEQDVYPVIELNVLKEDYAPFAEGSFYSWWYEESWDQTLEYSPSTGLYRFQDLWANGYDYFFKVADDGKITQVPNPTKSGYVSSTYGMVSVTEQGTSKFDSGTNVYTFVLKWTVTAGSFGVGEEIYTVTSNH